MARMALGEALTNLVFARVTALRDVKASGKPQRAHPCRVPVLHEEACDVQQIEAN